jgi:hypothetical protein
MFVLPNVPLKLINVDTKYSQGERVVVLNTNGVINEVKETLSLLAFGVTPKVFTPCFGVLHVMWSEWCVDYPWPTTNIPTRDSLLLDC